MENPRKVIEEMIKREDFEGLLKKAGELHGHFCPFLSLGVRAGCIGVRELRVKTEGMEEFLAVIETNSCFSDGIQITTGCSFGNNALIYRDVGKTAVSFVKRDGKGIRIRVKVDSEWLNERYPDAAKLFDKVVKRREQDKTAQEKLQKVWKEISFDILNFTEKELFEVKDVSLKIPDYAPIFESVTCSVCGEKLMQSKARERAGKIFCLPCSHEGLYQLDGEGISFYKEDKKQSYFRVFPIGYVESSFSFPDDPEKMREKESFLFIYPEYEEGLYRIEESDFINVVFYFHQSSGYTLKGKRRGGEIRGVFASRSPHRPSPIGLTRVKLIAREKNRLRVKGLDAIDGTPILDIKPYVKDIDG